MISIEVRSADEAWRELVRKIKSSGLEQESRDQRTKELLHVGLTITDPRQRLVFSRPMNPAFAIAEVVSILAGSNDLSFLEFWNPRMRNYSDDGLRLCGAYGYRLGSQPEIGLVLSKKLRRYPSQNYPPDQLKMAYQALAQTPNSRQVVLQIWNSELDMPNPHIRSKDVPCNIVSHLMIRDGKLEWLQVMRSNDLIWGLPYNIIQFTSIQEILAGWLGVDVGSYVHLSDSLHIYRRHWKDLEAILDHTASPINQSDLRIGSYASWEELFRRILSGTVDLTEKTTRNDLMAVYADLSTLPIAYRQWMALLCAEALRKRHFVEEADELAQEAGRFWNTSWRNWVGSKTKNREEHRLTPALS